MMCGFREKAWITFICRTRIFEDIKVLQQENTELTNRGARAGGRAASDEEKRKDRTEVTEVGKETENEELFQRRFREKDYLSRYSGLEQHDIRMYSPLTLAYIRGCCV